MKAVGIICEYNPFHNGHAYHIEKVRSLYKDAVIVLVLGGYFLERGDVSLISKWNKTRIALEYGVDLVLELPILYGVNAGDYFAYNAVLALNKAGVSKIIFGSERDDVSFLRDVALKQSESCFDDEVKRYLDKGCNYPSSLSKALGVVLSSNDLLGVSYIKAIDKINPSIEPVTIKRTNDFNDLESDDDIVSASNIREKIKNGLDVKKYIPNYDSSFINNIDEDKMFYLLKYKILTDSNLDSYLGVDEGLENKLKKVILEVNSYQELLDRIKSKRYTVSRLKRMLIHILIGIKKEDIDVPFEVVRILGFNSAGKSYLKELKSKDLSYKINSRYEEIERVASIIYYDLSLDESVRWESLNRPIEK